MTDDQETDKQKVSKDIDHSADAGDGLSDFFAVGHLSGCGNFGNVRLTIEQLELELDETSRQMRDVSDKRNTLEQKIATHLAQVKLFTDKHFDRHKNAS